MINDTGGARLPDPVVHFAFRDIEIDDVAQVPDEHVRLERIASKLSIMAEYKRTGIVPAGARIRAGTRYLKIT